MEYLAHFLKTKFAIDDLHFGSGDEGIALRFVEVPIFVAVHILRISDTMLAECTFIILQRPMPWFLLGKAFSGLCKEAFPFGEIDMDFVKEGNGINPLIDIRLYDAITNSYCSYFVWAKAL